MALLRVGHVERIPRSLQQKPHVGIMLEPELDEVRDARVRHHYVRGHCEDVDLAGHERLLRFVLRVRLIPMLNDLRAADPLPPGEHVPLNAGLLHELLDHRRHEHMKAVSGVEHANALRRLRFLGIRETMRSEKCRC